MKNYIVDLLVWILRKMKVSVVIGMDVYDKTIKAKYKISRWYNSSFDLEKFTFYDSSGESFEIPENKPFKIIR